MGKWLALVMTLCVAAIIGFGTQRTPLPKPATAPAMDFAAGRAMLAMVDVEGVACSRGW